MGYLIGTDEAGYGPNLGPLVISATLWEVADGVGGDDLYRLLEGAIAARGTAGVVMADSKMLYQSGKGLGLLERGLWAAFALMDRAPRTCTEVWELFAPGAVANRREEFGYSADETPLPLDAAVAESRLFGAEWKQAVAAAGVRLRQVRSRAIFPREFNELLQKHDSKGALLSRATLDLAAAMIDGLPRGPVAVLCDKHGGRNRYAPLLEESFPESFVEIHGESRSGASIASTCPSAASSSAFRPCRSASAGGPGLDGLEVSPRTGHAGMERFLGPPPAGLGAHGRLSARRRSLQGPDCPAATRTGHGRSFHLEDQVMDLYIIRHAWAGHFGDPAWPDDSQRP